MDGALSFLSIAKSISFQYFDMEPLAFMVYTCMVNLLCSYTPVVPDGFSSQISACR